MGETYRRTNITTTLHWSGLYGSVAKLNPPQWRHMKTHLEFAKEYLKDPQTVRNIIIWSDEPQFQASCLKETSSAHHLQSTIPKVKCAGGSIMLWSCFSAVGTEGLIRVEEKLNALKHWDGLNENPVQSIQNLRLGRRFTFQQDNDPKHTARVAYRQLCECPWVAESQPGIEPNQTFLWKPENVHLPPSNLTAWEVKRWGEEWQIIAKCWWAKLVASNKKRPETVKVLQLNIYLKGYSTPKWKCCH